MGVITYKVVLQEWLLSAIPLDLGQKYTFISKRKLCESFKKSEVGTLIQR